jgi:Mg-chelatase subunit ChlD
MKMKKWASPARPLVAVTIALTAALLLAGCAGAPAPSGKSARDADRGAAAARATPAPSPAAPVQPPAEKAPAKPAAPATGAAPAPATGAAPAPKAAPAAPATPPTPPAAAGGEKREDRGAATAEARKSAEAASRSEGAKAGAATGLADVRSSDKASRPRVEFELAEKPSSSAPTPPPAPGSRPAATAAPERRPAAQPQASGLKAGFADDNKQFNYFVQFLEKYAGQAENRDIPIGERLVVRALDVDGKSIPNALVRVSAGGNALTEGLTYADGTFAFFPLEYPARAESYRVEVTSGGRTLTTEVRRRGERVVTVRFDRPRQPFQQVPLDILFVLDTTGSMGEEIERLKTTIELINLNLTSLSSKPRVRFGMVLYKDRGSDEEYRTRVVPFTDNLEQFQAALAKVEAGGGGDTPEDLEAALEQSIKGVRWNRDGIRLAFVITDAPAHLQEYRPAYTYVDAVHDARRAGIKYFSVGTGGLPLDGEMLLRQIAQYTYGKYIFLTYGESDESEGGAPGSVSHHTGANFQTDKLEAIIIRFAREELAYLTDQPLDQGEDYFEANRIADEKKGDTLDKLFEMALGQLVDYSSVRLAAGTRAATLPVVPAPEGLKLDAEYFSDSLVQALTRNKAFTAVERKDLQKILAELQLQLSGLADESNAARVGKIMGAEVLLSGTLYRKADTFELFLKLVRVETGEVLAVTKARIDIKLGLSG